MDVNALHGTEDFAVETSDAVLRILDDRDFPAFFSLHVDHIRRTNRIAKPTARAFVQIDVNDHCLA
jgi:hypothetical protein